MNNSVLIIDDDPLTLNLLRLILESAAFDVYTSENGLNALQTAKSIKPAAIITDIMMPIVDGIEVCRKLRDEGETAVTPILILTTCTQLSIIETCKELGVINYLIKPVPRSELIKAVKNAILTAAIPT